MMIELHQSSEIYTPAAFFLYEVLRRIIYVFTAYLRRIISIFVAGTTSGSGKIHLQLQKLAEFHLA